MTIGQCERSELGGSMLKCRNCENLIIEKVNKDFSRGRGRCFKSNCLWGWAWDHELGRCKCFSDQACMNYIPRTSTLEIGNGG